MKHIILLLIASMSMAGCALAPSKQVYTAPSNAGVQASINGAQNNVNSAQTSTKNTSNAIGDAKTDRQKLQQLIDQLKATQLSNK